MSLIGNALAQLGTDRAMHLRTGSLRVDIDSFFYISLVSQAAPRLDCSNTPKEKREKVSNMCMSLVHW